MDKQGGRKKEHSLSQYREYWCKEKHLVNVSQKAFVWAARGWVFLNSIRKKARSETLSSRLWQKPSHLRGLTCSRLLQQKHTPVVHTPVYFRLALSEDCNADMPLRCMLYLLQWLQQFRDEEIKLTTFTCLPLFLSFNTSERDQETTTVWQNYQTLFGMVEQGTSGFLEDDGGSIRRKEGFKLEQNSSPNHCTATWWGKAEQKSHVTLEMWNRISVDESKCMMEGRLVFRQQQPDEGLKKLRLLKPQRKPQITALLSPFAPHGSRNPPVTLGIEGEAVCCRS